MRKIIQKIALVLILISRLLFPLFAAQNDFPSLEPYIELSLGDDPTPEEIMRASFLFSEYPAINVEPYMEKYRELEKELFDPDFLSKNDEEKADSILHIIYDCVLLSYSKPQTRLTTAFDKGSYNCVSSAILYYCLAKKAGLEVYANRVPDHCFCTVVIGGKHIDVETTNPMGFNPGEKKQISSSASGTKYAIMPKNIYRGRVKISARALVSLVPQNVISYNLSTNNYASFVPIAAARRVFLENESDPYSSDGVQVFDVVATNYDAILNRSKRYVDSMLWMESVVNRWGMSEGLRENYDNAVFNAVLSLCEKNDFDKADEEYQKRKENLGARTKAETEKIIFVYETNSKSQSLGSEEKTIAYLKEQMKNPLASDPEIKKQLVTMLENSWIKILNANKNDFLKSAEIASNALVDLPRSQKIKQFRQQCLSNYAVEVHNEFAKLANKGQYEKAMKVLQKGLENVPDNQRLLSDMKQLKKIMGQ